MHGSNLSIETSANGAVISWMGARFPARREGLLGALMWPRLLCSRVNRVPQALEIVPNLKAISRPKSGEAKIKIGTEDLSKVKLIKDLFVKYRNAVANDDSEIGVAGGVQMHIDTFDDKPVTDGKYRRVPYSGHEN
jgi:hypothetical protein